MITLYCVYIQLHDRLYCPLGVRHRRLLQYCENFIIRLSLLCPSVLREHKTLDSLSNTLVLGFLERERERLRKSEREKGDKM